MPAPGTATALQIIPADHLVHLCESVPYRVRSKDARGATVATLDAN